jgi:signal transduction histidine kinase
VEEARAMIEGINAGADDYIPKSGDFEVLKARVRAQLRRKQFEDEYRAIQQKLLEKELQASESIRVMNAELELRVQQRTADLKAANEELESFSYSVSHDLRAPLRAIDGFSKMLLEECGEQLAAEGQRYLTVIRQNTGEMNQLIEGLLALARVGRSDLAKSRFSLCALVRKVIDDLQREREGRDVEFVVHDLPWVEADAVLIRQVLINLVSNALKYTRPRKTSRIEIGARPLGELNGEGSPAADSRFDLATPVYYVRDNGVGFNMKYADKLFGAFQRLHIRTDFEGTGIGLATVQRIIHRHGGRVWAHAEMDQGATFYFTLG